MKQYLFLFTIGPVQSFIAQARKTQDLYVGSKLLSDLTKKAMEKLKEIVQNPEFIFPNEDIKSKPNRFVATIESDDAEKVGKKLEDFAKAEFKRVAQKALDPLDINYNDDFRDSFDKQINDFLQIYWVALPLSLNDDYPHAYKKLENNLGAIKNVRNFKQLKETGRKCSLCGERNILFYRKTSSGKIPAYTPKCAAGLKDEYRLNPGEGLCAVCFTKRFYRTSSFPSTAEISAMDWLDNIPNDRKDCYKSLFNNFDEQLYYEENLRKEYLVKYGNFKNEQSLDDAKKQLKELYKIKDNSKIDIGKPPKYYALIMLDGDNMGRWLSGDFLKEKKNLKDFHKKMSEKLGEYANDVSNIIQESKGKLVYSGGDDVLAFVNLKYLFPVMNDLRAEFPKFEDLGFELTDNQKSSASAGIVIAHYKTPLSEVLSWARRMEEEAKSIDDEKNAFTIAVLKRSGEISKTAWKWDLDDNRGSKKIKLLWELVNELQDDKKGFSNTFIKNLNIEFMKLDEIEDKLLKVELKRLLERSSQIKGDKKSRDSKVEDWKSKLFKLYIVSIKKDNFLSFLNIADFLARRIK